MWGAEAEFVLRQLANSGCRPGEILDLGCGTGRHAAEFVRRGCSVCGVDSSERMVGIARERLVSSQLRFEAGNIQTWRSAARFDAVLSLFHVISYQTEYSELSAAIETARTHLKPDGLFLFDFWYGPAVLTAPPAVRIKRLTDGHIELLRIAEPLHIPNENRVVVDYTILALDRRNGRFSEFQERHNVRYWFQPELNMMLTNGGFKMEHSGGWQSDQPLGADTWYGFIVARKT